MLDSLLFTGAVLLLKLWSVPPYWRSELVTNKLCWTRFTFFQLQINQLFSPSTRVFYSQNQDKSHTSCTLQQAVVLSFALRFCKQFLHLFIAFALLQLDFLWNTVRVCHWSTLFHSFILARMGCFCPFNFFVRCNCVISEVKAFKNICVCTTISYKRTPWPLRSGAPELEEFDPSPPDWVSVQSVVANYCCHVLKYREIQYCAKVWSHHSFLYILFQNLL